MQSLQEQRRLVSERRQADFEAYQQWEYQRRRYDEITDVAERVRAPISPTQEFMMTANGLVSERGEPLRHVLEDGLADARRMAAINPDWQVEVSRREIDMDEYNALEDLAVKGGAMVSYWLIPDAVREGNSSLPGYNRERLKMFTRIAVATPTGVAIKYSSYDGSYGPGVQAMDEALGFTFDPNRTSEEIAAERRHMPESVESVHEIDEKLRVAYDGALVRDFGGEWYGGRPPLPIKDVVGFISSQTKLLGEHMSILSKIFAETLDPYERNRRMEPHRYNLAAAMDDLVHGKQVASLVEAGDGARSEGRDLDGDCPTGDRTTEQQLESVGFKTANRFTIWGSGECVACLRDTLVAVNKCNMCQNCEDTHNLLGNTGLDVVMTEARNRRAAEKAKKAKIGAFAAKKR